MCSHHTDALRTCLQHRFRIPAKRPERLPLRLLALHILRGALAQACLAQDLVEWRPQGADVAARVSVRETFGDPAPSRANLSARPLTVRGRVPLQKRQDIEDIGMVGLDKPIPLRMTVLRIIRQTLIVPSCNRWHRAQA